jgi:ATP-dependent helicase/nuclease subunit B
VKGRARYLYEFSPTLQRSLTARWMRWHRRQWEPPTGSCAACPRPPRPRSRQRVTARPYSLTALQRFAACPYQFMLSAVYRLAPLEEPAPLQKLDPLTRGDLFHASRPTCCASFRSWACCRWPPRPCRAAAKLLEGRPPKSRRRPSTNWRRPSSASGATR